MAAVITGDKALDRKLARLAGRDSGRARRAAAKAGITEIAKGIRSEVPVGPTKNLKKSIGGRVAKAKGGPQKGVTEAKAGVNVGKKRGKRAPHAHLVGLGTKERTRRKLGGKFAGVENPTAEQLGTGAMPADDFVRRGFDKASGAAKAKTLGKLAKEIEKAAAKK